MKRKLLLLQFTLLLVLLAACSKNSNITTEHQNGNKESLDNREDNKEIEIQNGSRIEKTLSSGIIVDAKLTIPDKARLESMPVFDASLQEIPFDTIYRTFMKDKEIEHKNEEQTEDNIGNGIFKYYTTTDGCSLTYSGGVFIYYSSSRYNNINIDTKNENDDSTEYDKDFGFKMREEAGKEIQKVLSGIGIEVYEKYNCYALDYQMLQQANKVTENEIPDEKKSATMSEQPIWNEDLNCYLFEFFGVVNHMPITNQIREVKDSIIPATEIKVLYSQNGIEQITISECFNIESEKYQSSIQGVEEALDKLDEKYNSIILEGNYYVEKIQLEYIPIETKEKGIYELIPGWRFYIIHEMSIENKEEANKTDLYRIPTQVLFNAISGEEIQTGVGM